MSKKEQARLQTTAYIFSRVQPAEARFTELTAAMRWSFYCIVRRSSTNMKTWDGRENKSKL